MSTPTKKPVYISDFLFVRPRHIIPQENILDYIANLHFKTKPNGRDLNFYKNLVKRYACSPTKIASRGSDVGDIVGEIELGYADRPGTEKRNSTAEKYALLHAHRMYESQSVTAPEHLIHVSCTAYTSPSAAQSLVDEKGWNTKTAVTHFYHMGCYAALPAVRAGKAFVDSAAMDGETIRVDVMHNELCSFHLDLDELTPEQTVIQSLFGDGHIRYSLSNELPAATPGWEILSQKEMIVPNTRQFMAWRVGDSGMKMVLSREVPNQIRDALPAFVDSLWGKNSDLNNRENCLYAIHPGGPKIIEGVRDQLKLSEESVRFSIETLLQYGNMSSATVPHVWTKILADDSVRDGSLVLSLAFGPGLSIFGSIMRKVHKT